MLSCREAPQGAASERFGWKKVLGRVPPGIPVGKEGHRSGQGEKLGCEAVTAVAILPSPRGNPGAGMAFSVGPRFCALLTLVIW